MASLQLFLYAQKDILIYKILPLIDGKDGAHLSETCIFMRKLIRDLAEDHVLSKRMRRHIVYLNSVENFGKIPERYERYHEQIYFCDIPGENQRCFYDSTPNCAYPLLVITDFSSKNWHLDDISWKKILKSFKTNNCKWKLIQYPPLEEGKYRISESDHFHICQGFSFLVKMPGKKI